MLLLFSLIGFMGCEKENLFVSPYDDYLDLATYEMSRMSAKDMETVSKAIRRLDIKNENNLFQIKQTSGAHVNISEDLFNYIKDGFEVTNRIVNHQPFNEMTLRVKSGNPEGGTQPQDSTRCVAYALSGLGINLNRAISYIDSLGYSNGVPADSMYAVFRNFFPNGRSVNINTMNYGTMPGNLLYFRTFDSTGHAVNGTFYDSGSRVIMYNDLQNGQTGFTTSDQVMGLFLP